ncbi:5409_t:CDS:2 [Funneliformis mosseae]|uniref:NudC domain-containing protein 1 n=1 Tax=Funneliformis mosseae TaxID=27381 RepID=A0A9N9EHF6_FUNMO|nr:5409_t:CDS:2 [Funneliformis mosseae]
MSNNGSKYTVPIKPIRDLLNPKFEGYKLKVFDENSRLLHFRLPPPGITLSKIPTNKKLSYKEILSRSHFNHLFKGFEIKEKVICFYFDSENFVVLVEYDMVTSNIVTHRLLKIQQPNYSGNVGEKNSSHQLYSNYSSLRALSSNLILVTNGSGEFVLVQITKNDDTSLYSSEILYQAGFQGHSPKLHSNYIPCVLLDGRIVGDDILFIVYNRALNPMSSDPTKEVQNVLFDISLLQIPLTPPFGMKIIHVLRGPDIPLYCSIEFDGTGYVIGSNSEYEVVYKLSTQEDTMEPMDIENDQKSAEQNEKSTTVQEVKNTSPYIWTQTPTDITIYFQLPRGTPKTAIHCNFSQTHLSLTVNLGDTPPYTTEHPPIPCYAFTRLFDLIDPSVSLWTIEPTIGLLTLHLEKQDHNTRWSHVFQHDDGVFETLDPNEFAEFRERLEKFTADANEQLNQSEFKRLQHPIGHEMEESIDYEGQSSIFMWFDRDGSLSAKASGDNEFLCKQFENLENTGFSDNISSLPSVCLKSDVDGIVYSIRHSTDSSISVVSPLIMTHVATFNAFAFVQASKREKRFMYHDPENRFAIILEGDHRAFVYRRHESCENHDEQFVIELAVNSNDDSEIIGVQMVSIENAHIMILKSNSIMLIKLL